MIATTETYDSYRAGVHAELRSAFDGRRGMVYDLLRYHLGWVDERGNPTDDSLTTLHHCGVLAMASADAVSGARREAVTAAAAVELAYNFVLVHNDVQAGRIDQDNDRPSIWWVWGSIAGHQRRRRVARPGPLRADAHVRCRGGCGNRSGRTPGIGSGMFDPLRRAVHGPDVPGPTHGVRSGLHGYDRQKVRRVGRVLGAPGWPRRRSRIGRRRRPGAMGPESRHGSPGSGGHIRPVGTLG